MLTVHGPRRIFCKQLQSYLSFWKSLRSAEEIAEQSALVEKFITLLQEPHCFERANATAHFTASAVLVNSSRDEVLLTLHKKLGKWLQLGGHADGEEELALVALREAKEESGLEQVVFGAWRGWAPAKGEPPLFFDLDIHWIPDRLNEPGHFHYDARYLLVTSTPHLIQRSTESEDLRWFSMDEAREMNQDQSLCRQLDKLRDQRSF